MPYADAPSRSLQLTEAQTRFDQLSVTSYDVRLDLATSAELFGSVTTIRFESTGGPTFVDLKPATVNSIVLNGRPVEVDCLDRGRLPVTTAAGTNELVVDAVMRFRNDGEGLHRSIDPADKLHYVYGMSFMDAAPSIFACFDQPDLKAPYTFHVLAPTDWTVIGNAPGEQVEPGVWEFEQTLPLSTYFVTLVAGPYHVINDEHDGIPLGLSARQSIAKDLDADADELFTMTRQCFDEFHRLFGIRYPFGNYHQAFVPEFNAGAMENPGCVTFRDPMIFSSRVTRGIRISRASTVAHEMAHQWFGNITTPKWWDDLWLNESFAEYMGNRVTADVTQYDDAWVHNAHSRRQWGLTADQRPTTHPVAGNGAVDASAALQDFDGISYAKGSSILKQVNATLGDGVFFAGVRDHFERHRFGNATMHDLFASWERAGAGDLTSFTHNWLRTAGPDVLRFDRTSGVVRRTPPAAHAADRGHTVQVAIAAPGSPWRISSVTTSGAETPLVAGADEAVVLDPFEDTWAVVQHDETTVSILPQLLPATGDAMVRAGIWNGIRSAFHNAALVPRYRPGPGRGRDSGRGQRRRPDLGPALGPQGRRSPLGRPVRGARPGAPRQPRAPRHRRTGLDRAAGGVPVDDQHRHRRDRAARLAQRLRRPGRRLGRPRPALADPDPARDDGRDRSLRAAASTGRRAHGSITGGARLRDGVAAGRRGEGLGVGPVPRRRGRPQLRGGGQWHRHVAGRPRAPHGTLRRPVLR